ncbi:NAD(P)-dependent oxidoreductase [bacterium]|nr:NAD(P)-dependent oxidoreductase [bacterium]
MKHIFITGASGCVGHYVTEQLLNANDDWHLHLLLRSTSNLKWIPESYPNVTVHFGNMDSIERLADVLHQMDYVMHIFTDWSNSEYATLLNVTKTHQLFSLLDPDRIQRIIYFSTASILGPGNQPIPQAGLYGPGYVRSKYYGFLKLTEHPLKSKIVTLFPTLVFGGDRSHPYSHISSGILPNIRYLNILRFMYLDARFHFMHSSDIAQCAIHLLTAVNVKSQYVLGNSVMTGKDTIRELCEFFKIPVLFSIKVPVSVVFFVAKLLRITIAPWEKYCLENPYFQYDVVAPSDFGLTTRFPNLRSVLRNLVNENE